MEFLSGLVSPEILKMAIPILVIIILVILAVKISGKIFKVILAIVFVGFIIYLFSGINIVSELLKVIGVAPVTP